MLKKSFLIRDTHAITFHNMQIGDQEGTRELQGMVCLDCVIPCVIASSALYLRNCHFYAFLAFEGNRIVPVWKCFPHSLHPSTLPDSYSGNYSQLATLSTEEKVGSLDL